MVSRWGFDHNVTSNAQHDEFLDYLAEIIKREDAELAIDAGLDN